MKFVSFKPGSVIVDIGTGGGFPAVPLAILNPHCSFIAIDSTGKKIKVLSTIINNANIKNILPVHGRFENKKDIKGHYILGRAVAPIPQLIKWTKNRFIHEEIPHPYSPSSLIYLKGSDIENDIIFLEKNEISYFIYYIGEKIPLPYFKEKTILIILSDTLN